MDKVSLTPNILPYASVVAYNGAMGKHRLNEKKRADGKQWSAQVVVEGQKRSGQWPPTPHSKEHAAIVAEELTHGIVSAPY